MLGVAAGIVGVLLPLVPGPVLILGAAIVHKLLLPGWLSWGMIIALAVLTLVERAADILGTLSGARWMGATKWGLLGAAIGGLVGIFFGFVGLLIGPIIGAFVAEMLLARRRTQESFRAGVGAGVGIGVSTVARLAIALFMAALVVFDVVAL